jgi:hypothetical protein
VLNQVTEWIDGYVRAWNSNDPDEIGALFTADAEYRTAPYHQPWRGRDQIVKDWLGRQDKPGETSFEWQPVVVTDEVAVIQGTTRYPKQTFRNLWVIKLDGDGRCHAFTEWWMEEPRHGGR